MIREYHRPTRIDEAVELATRPRTVILGGGTVINADPGDAESVVDLQALDLAQMSRHDGAVQMGSMVTLQAIADHPDVPAVIRSLAERELPSVLRNAATIGGTVAVADASSELLTALLALGTTIDVVTAEGTFDLDLPGFWAQPTPVLITAVRVPTGGRTASDRTARTPRDHPIVCAAAHRTDAGETRLALGGVADRPISIEAAAIADLDPPSDFRGSSEYRRHLASILAGRVMAAVDGVR